MLTKIAVVLLLIFVLFYGAVAIARLGLAPRRQQRRQRDERSSSQLLECPRCGAYVPEGSCDCGRERDRAG